MQGPPALSLCGGDGGGGAGGRGTLSVTDLRDSWSPPK